MNLETMPPPMIRTVPCTHCGKPLKLTWTGSAEGWPIYHGDCYRQTHSTD